MFYSLPSPYLASSTPTLHLQAYVAYCRMALCSLPANCRMLLSGVGIGTSCPPFHQNGRSILRPRCYSYLSDVKSKKRRERKQSVCCISQSVCCIPQSGCCIPQSVRCIPQSVCCIPQSVCCISQSVCCISQPVCCISQSVYCISQSVYCISLLSLFRFTALYLPAICIVHHPFYFVYWLIYFLFLVLQHSTVQCSAAQRSALQPSGFCSLTVCSIAAATI